MGALKLQTAPATEPITTSEAKTHLRVDFSTDDTYIDTLITSARQFTESYVGQTLVTTTWDLYLDGFGDCDYRVGDYIRLPMGPVQSITSISYLDENNASQTWTSTKYRLDTATLPGRVLPVVGETYPTTYPTTNAVTIRFVAGYGAASAVPLSLKHAVKILVAHLYENREITIQGSSISQVPMAYDSFCWMERVGNL